MGEVRDADRSDLDALVELADIKRQQYQHYTPTFHRPAADAKDTHQSVLQGLGDDPETITLIHEGEDGVDGFLIGTVVKTPPVYDPGGTTCIIDDYTVARSELWDSVGRALLVEGSAKAKKFGAVQIVVVCHPADRTKRTMLLEKGMVVASEWLTTPLI